MFKIYFDYLIYAPIFNNNVIDLYYYRVQRKDEFYIVKVEIEYSDPTYKILYFISIFAHFYYIIYFLIIFHFFFTKL